MAKSGTDAKSLGLIISSVAAILLLACSKRDDRSASELEALITDINRAISTAPTNRTRVTVPITTKGILVFASPYSMDSATRTMSAVVGPKAAKQLEREASLANSFQICLIVNDRIAACSRWTNPRVVFNNALVADVRNAKTLDLILQGYVLMQLEPGINESL